MTFTLELLLKINIFVRGAIICNPEVKVLVAQSCPNLCDPVDCSLPDSSVRGVLQARILQWIAMPPSGMFI